MSDIEIEELKRNIKASDSTEVEDRDVVEENSDPSEPVKVEGETVEALEYQAERIADTMWWEPVSILNTSLEM